jgi:hypothetical protein
VLGTPPVPVAPPVAVADWQASPEADSTNPSSHAQSHISPVQSAVADDGAPGHGVQSDSEQPIFGAGTTQIPPQFL